MLKLYAPHRNFKFILKKYSASLNLFPPAQLGVVAFCCTFYFFEKKLHFSSVFYVDFEKSNYRLERGRPFITYTAVPPGGPNQNQAGGLIVVIVVVKTYYFHNNRNSFCCCCYCAFECRLLCHLFK